MSYYNEENRSSGPLRLPDLDEQDPDPILLDYQKRYFNRLANYRCRVLTRMSVNVNYVLGRQWIELDRDIIADGSRGYIIRDMTQGKYANIPRPVTNLIYPAVEVELSALTKRQFSPKVMPNSSDPKTEAAARVATDILDHKLRVQDWDSLRRQVTRSMIITGTGCLKSYWDETYADTVMAYERCFRCPSTGQLFASNTVPKEQLDKVQFGRSSLSDIDGDEDNLQMNQSPVAPDTTLEEYEPTPDEAMGSDMFGRPLAQEAPKGDCKIEVVSPFDLFVENSGIGVSTSNCKIWGQATVRSMDWMNERVPDEMHRIEPEDPADLMRWHPTLGEWNLLGNYNSTLDSSIYEDHVTLYELYVEPNYRFPNGRAIWIASDEVLFDGDLYKQVGDKRVAAVKYAAATYVDREGEFFGNGLVDFLISPQNRYNGMDAQIIEARERMGSPHLLLRDGLSFKGPFINEEWGSGKFMYYEADPSAPNYEPHIFGNQTMDSSVYQERDRVEQNMKVIAGPQDVDVGEAPRNVGTTSGIQLLIEQGEQLRSARQGAITSMVEKIWSHQLDLLWTLRVEGEEDSYAVETPHGSWAERQFVAEDIAGQTKVKVEKQAYVSKSLYQKEAAREAQADGLYRLDSPVAIKRLLELRGLPTDVNENINRQVESARRMWVDFFEEGILPTIDTTLDDPNIHYEVLGTFLKSPDGKDMAEAVGWPEINKTLAGWQEVFNVAYMKDKAARQYYGGRIDPMAAQEMYNQGMMQFQAAQAQYQAAQQQAAVQTAQTGAPVTAGEPPQPPPAPEFLPDSLEDKITAVWDQYLQLRQAQLPETAPTTDPQEGADTQQLFLRFRAIVEAYKILAQEQAEQVQAGIPIPGAPGNDSPDQSPDPSNFSSPPQPPSPGESGA